MSETDSAASLPEFSFKVFLFVVFDVMYLQGGCKNYPHSVDFFFEILDYTFQLSFRRFCRYFCLWVGIVFEGFNQFEWVSECRGHHDKCKKNTRQNKIGKGVLDKMNGFVRSGCLL